MSKNRTASDCPFEHVSDQRHKIGVCLRLSFLFLHFLSTVRMYLFICSNKGFWSTTGCVQVKNSSTRSVTTCLCKHLTNFAILTQYSGFEVKLVSSCYSCIYQKKVPYFLLSVELLLYLPFLF